MCWTNFSEMKIFIKNFLIVSDLRNQTGNHSLFVNSVKCGAHTIQLAVKDFLALLSKSDQNIIDLCRLVAKFLRKQSSKNEMRHAGLSSILPGLDVQTRWSSTYLMVCTIEINTHFIAFNAYGFFTLTVCRFAAF